MRKGFQLVVNLLATLPENYNIYVVNKSQLLDLLKNKLMLIGGHMETKLDQFNRKSVRMTILKQEEVFKEQVRELHRLYKVQKMLMAEFRNCAKKYHSPTNPNKYSCGRANLGYNFHSLFSLRVDPSLQEHTSSICSTDTSKSPKGFNLEHSAQEISTNISASEDQAEPNTLSSPKGDTNISSNCDPCFSAEEDSEIELSLSIGFGTSKRKINNHKPHNSQEFGYSKSDNYEGRQLDPSLRVTTEREECSDRANNINSDTATCARESVQQPPWLFQTLSLNRS